MIIRVLKFTQKLFLILQSLNNTQTPQPPMFSATQQTQAQAQTPTQTPLRVTEPLSVPVKPEQPIPTNEDFQWTPGKTSVPYYNEPNGISPFFFQNLQEDQQEEQKHCFGTFTHESFGQEYSARFFDDIAKNSVVN